jgi:hypothetical protein
MVIFFSLLHSNHAGKKIVLLHEHKNDSPESDHEKGHLSNGDHEGNDEEDDEEGNHRLTELRAGTCSRDWEGE